MAQIILSTLNARYIHASLGLRYLKANMGELTGKTRILEFTINQQTESLAEAILSEQPEIVGFGVYIWNTLETYRLVALLKAVKPDLLIVLGGPEVSFEYQKQAIVELADYLITGPADLAFRELCRGLLSRTPPVEKIINAGPVPPGSITLPYAHYTDEDIRNRVLYVEASRGCPFKCEFCLSALDKTAWPFDLELFLREMQALYDRGARHFKFVDRTFNLKVRSSLRILAFFLEKLEKDEVFLHFELIPDRLPDELKTVLTKFPEGTLQFEIGVQTFNPEVQYRINRKQDNRKTAENLQWIREQTHAHIHADLIIGLPGETVRSFAEGFDRLYRLKPHEIQVGILKRLRGTPIDRHSKAYAMRYNPQPPYNILATSELNFAQMQMLVRFARYWDMIANSGRFQQSLPLILAESPFANFRRLSEALFEMCGQTHRIALRKLFDYLFLAMTNSLNIDGQTATTALEYDYSCSGLKGWFRVPIEQTRSELKHKGKSHRRQRRHYSGVTG